MILAVIATSSLCDVTEIFTITGELNFLSIYLSLGVLVINPFIVLHFLSQGIVWPFIIAGVLTNIINVIFHVIFLFALDLGVK